MFEVGTLKKIARGHRQVFLTNDLSDNIASHSHRVSIIGYFLGKKENANVPKILKMCLFHDVGETRTGDQTWIHKRYIKVDEENVMNDQVLNLDDDNEIYDLLNELKKLETKESKIVKDADNLDQYLLVKEYVQQGNREAETWLNDSVVNIFYTDSAKELFNLLETTNPSDWTEGLYVT